MTQAADFGGPVRDSYRWPVGSRGVNSLELFHDGQRWWIASRLWAAELPQAPIPAERLPSAQVL